MKFKGGPLNAELCGARRKCSAVNGSCRDLIGRK